MKRGKLKYIIAIAIIVMLYIAALFYSNTRLTYLEYTTVNDKRDTIIALDTNEDELRQAFIMPYDIFDSVSIQIGTYARDNNSTWEFTLTDKAGKVLYTDTFIPNNVVDNAFHRHKIDKRIDVTKGDLYYFSVKAKEVSGLSKLAFYVSEENNSGGLELTHNGEPIDNTLCFKVYGGDKSLFWYGFFTFIFIYILVIVLRFYFDEKNNKCYKDDKLLLGMIVGAITFAVLCTFAVGVSFTDEYDNMRGGMVIANGGVLYRDYITQHTPVVYHLCSVFVLFGAGSVEQIRLLYFIFECIIWGFIYYRHSEFFGKKKMVLLPILESICIVSLISPQGYQVLSDGFEGLMFTILLLEFLRYLKDHELGWDRSIIVSICIWGSVGAAFVSAYALIFLVLIFIVLEAAYLSKNKVPVKKIIIRYCKLIIALAIPPIAAVIYFKANHALGAAFDQFYTFNREIYPQYQYGLGGNIIQPFVNAVQNFFEIIANNFNSIVAATATNVTILQLVIVGLAVGIIIKLLEKKQYIVGLSLGLMMVFSATRGYGFHGLAAWYIAILIIVLYIDLFADMAKKIGRPLLVIFALILASTFFIAVGNNILQEMPSITDTESGVIDITEKDENKDIFLDAFCCDSLYLFYKNRKPVNPAVYMLPWYMDKYEKLDVNALLEKQPRVVVYNEDRDTWGMTHYTVIFDNVLKQYYTRLGDEGWEYKVWIRNEE